MTASYRAQRSGRSAGRAVMATDLDLGQAIELNEGILVIDGERLYGPGASADIHWDRIQTSCRHSI